MILVVTDGVRLTGELARQTTKDNRITLLKTFFDFQLQSLSFFACGKKHWKVVKTTGDGLLFTIDDASCASCNTKSPFQLVLETISDMHNKFKSTQLKIRCVCHWTDESINGIDIDCKGNNVKSLCNAKLFREDIFGLEVIRLMRIAALVQGPFCIATNDFMKQLVGYQDNFEDGQRTTKINDFNTNNRTVKVRLPKIPLPYLKGLDESEMRDKAIVSIKNPYLVWEIEFRDEGENGAVI